MNGVLFSVDEYDVVSISYKADSVSSDTVQLPLHSRQTLVELLQFIPEENQNAVASAQCVRQ